MHLFDPVPFLILTMSGLLLFAYTSHYKNALIYSTGRHLYLNIIFFGFASAVISLAIQIELIKIGPKETPFTVAFFYSAFTEEITKLIFILIALWYNRTRDILYDGIFYGAILGGTFGFVENLLYMEALPTWTILLRTVTSASLHLLNGGITGYYCMKFLFTKENYRYKYLVRGFVFCYIVHAFYNYAGTMGDMYLMLLPPILIYNFLLLEFISAYVRSCLPKYALDLIKLSLQDYELIRQYTKYEVWLNKTQRREKESVSLLKKVSKVRKVNVSISLFLGILFLILFPFFTELQKFILRDILLYEYISIFILFPIAAAISVFFAGLINPEFFKKQVLGVPLMCLLNSNSKEYSESTIVFYLTMYGFYAPFLFPEKMQGELMLSFLIGDKEFKNIKGNVIWNNVNEDEDVGKRFSYSVTGALIRFNGFPIKLIVYWNFRRWLIRLSNLLHSLQFRNE